MILRNASTRLLLTRISHEVWTGAMGGKSGARNFGSGRAGEVFRLLLVGGELWRAGTRRCAGTPRRLEAARAVGSGRRGCFQQRSAEPAAVGRCLKGA